MERVIVSVQISADGRNTSQMCGAAAVLETVARSLESGIATRGLSGCVSVSESVLHVMIPNRKQLRSSAHYCFRKVDGLHPPFININTITMMVESPSSANCSYTVTMEKTHPEEDNEDEYESLCHPPSNTSNQLLLDATINDCNIDNTIDHRRLPIKTATTQSSINIQTTKYNSRKPAWWLRLARKPTKAQKKILQDSAGQAYRMTRPRYGTLIDWKRVFSQEPLPIWYEIGCGNGDNILALSQLYRQELLFVGAEVHAAGIAVLLQRLLAMQSNKEKREAPLESMKHIDDNNNNNDDGQQKSPCTVTATNTNFPSSPNTVDINLRVFCGDGVALLSHIPSESLSAILITFPDPFPRNDQIPWRIFQTHTVQSMLHCLRRHGRLYLATDDPVLYAWAQEIVNVVNSNSSEYEPALQRLEPCPDRASWLPVVSKYEQKGLDAGRTTLLSCWEKM